VHNAEEDILTFFAVNRHGTETLDVEFALQGFEPTKIVDHQVMTHTMLEAVNTSANQNNVVPKKGNGAKIDDGKVKVSLPPYSYQMLRLKV
jgi:alpha-L-arabinofuranosidase